MKSFPSGSPQEERVELERVLGSIQAVNACLPQTTPDSGTATATSGLLNACSTLASAFSVFVLQTQVAICWLWGQISAILTRLDGVDTTLSTQAAEIAALQAATPAPIPGVLTVTAFSALGGGGTADLVAGSTTSDGLIHCTGGTSVSPAGGPACKLSNSLGWPANLRLIASEGNTSNAPMLLDYYVFAGDIYIAFYPFFGAFNDGDTFDIAYSIDEIA